MSSTNPDELWWTVICWLGSVIMNPGDFIGIRDKRKQLMMVQIAGDDLLPWPGPWTVRSGVVVYVIDDIPNAVFVW